MNQFERLVDNYADDINSTSKVYFKNKPEIINRSFYKLWEILTMLNLIDNTNNKFTSANIGDTPEGFIQAIIYFRELHSSNTKSDVHHSIKINNSEQPKDLYKTYKNVQVDNIKVIENIKEITKISSPMAGKIDLVTADGVLTNVKQNVRESKTFKILLGQVILALKIQNIYDFL